MPFLDWVNKNQAVDSAGQVPYHLLQLHETYGDKNAAQKNLIIQGDNLQALKALLPFYTDKVKCIFIDPPYNTGSAFEQYDDKLEHSQWLSMMYPRLVLLRELLAEDGSLWITIDDNEVHYLKVLCDEVFGRNNFVTSIAWQKFHSVKTNAKYRISEAHDNILIYKKSDLMSNFNFLVMDDEALKVYKNPDNDPRGLWRTAPLTVGLLGGARGAAFAKTGVSTGLYEIVAPNGKIHLPSKGRCWISKGGYENLLKEQKIWWGKDGNAVPMRKLFLSETGGKKICSTFWPHDEVGSNKAANEEQKELAFPEGAFSTPKPESLIERILHLATDSNDLVLDSFLGSGTTAAVAHKMGRRYIGIEMGAHAKTHCIPRIKKVIEGEQGGISKNVNWQGGGGFNFYTLGEAVFDTNGYINSNVRFNALAAYIWLLETKTSSSIHSEKVTTPFIGAYEGVAYYLLYNGILGDRRPNGGNVLTSQISSHLNTVYKHNGRKVVFGEASRIGQAKLSALDIVFKQIPYELHSRV